MTMSKYSEAEYLCNFCKCIYPIREINDITIPKSDIKLFICNYCLIEAKDETIVKF